MIKHFLRFVFLSVILLAWTPTSCTSKPPESPEPTTAPKVVAALKKKPTAAVPEPSGYNVSLKSISAFSDESQLTPNSSIFVFENDESKDPEMEKEIKGKISKLLKDQGYPFAESGETDFILFYSYTVQPSSEGEETYDSRILLELFDGKEFRQTGDVRSRWMGESVSTGIKAELSEVIDYLLVTAFEHFGKDTGDVLIVQIEKEDPRLNVFKQ